MPDTRRIRGSVGVKGVNRYADVILIQTLLNAARRRHAAYRKAIPERLGIDGNCGDKTRDAIRGYQSTVLGWRGRDVDGRISPNKATWHSLNGNVGGAAAPICKAPPSKPLLAGYTMFRQGSFGAASLGHGSLKISGHGCALCTLTMAATAIGAPTDHWPSAVRPESLTPLIANAIIKDAGGFHNSMLIMSKAANALGMSYDEFGRSAALRPADVGYIESALIAGLPVAAHVDYKASAIGDHWILIVQRNGDGTFVAVDPATGRALRLTRSPTANLGAKRFQPNARAVERGVLFGLGEGGTRNQQKYVVVRFALLAPATGGFSAGVD